jgi:DAACS family dicarboxylate/amino acid:cation (Na+ or H+) symporter
MFQRLSRSLALQIILALVLGLVVGPYLGRNAHFLGEISRLLIQLIKTIAVPLLFFAIWHAILTADIKGRSALKMVFIATFNATIALTIGLTLSNLFQPGKGFMPAEHHFSEADAKKLEAFKHNTINAEQFISGLIPNHILQPIIEQNVIALILLTLLLSWASKKLLQEKNINFESFTASGFALFEKALQVPIALLPIAVFGSVAKTVGMYGYEPLLGLTKYVGIGLLGLTLHILIVYQGWIWAYCRRSLIEFWRYARVPVIYALGSNSSLATLPITLHTLEKKLGVSEGSAGLGACIGTNLNNDGIILYEAMAVLFIAQAYGIPLSLGQQLLAAFSCMIAAMGIAGVPEAGVISLSLVLNTVGLPTEMLPILLSVDWILARSRSATNVLSDMVVSMILDKK